MKQWRTRLGLTVAALIGLGLLIYAFWPVPVEADVAPVIRGTLRVTVDEDGKTRIKDRYLVSAPLTGRLQRIGLHAGDPIRAGETLLAIIEPKDPDLLDASVRAQAESRVKATDAAQKQATAQLGKAKSEHKFAASELVRAKQAFDKGALAQQEFEAVENRERIAAESVRSALFAVMVAEFEWEQAKAALIRTRQRSTGEADEMRFEIRAPIDGRVLRVVQESSTIVAPGTQLLEVGDPADLEIVIDVLSTDAVRVVPGAKVSIEHWGGPEPLAARVRLIEPAAFTKISSLGVEEQRVNIIADFDCPREKHARLGDAFRVEARIVVWESDNVLKLPAGALFRREQSWAVFRIERGRAVLTPLQIGHSNGLETEIIDGLSENDRVITHPGDKVRHGVAVRSR